MELRTIEQHLDFMDRNYTVPELYNHKEIAKLRETLISQKKHFGAWQSPFIHSQELQDLIKRYIKILENG